MKILFMGTPDFAAESLKALLDDPHFTVAGVFTQPDKPKGRGMAVEFSPVKQIASDYGVPVYQPVKMRDGTALEIVRSIDPDIIVVVAYGRILPEEMLFVPRYGAVNIHASLLPRYRGSSPIQWAVLNGDAVTGVTSMYMAKEMDTGDMIYTEETEIGKYETSGELSDRLKKIGAKLLVRTLYDIESGKAPRIPQDHEKATYISMLDKSLSPIDWNRPAATVIHQICGLQPWPVATTTLDGQELKIHAAEYSAEMTQLAPGTVVRADRTGILVACAEGECIRITELQAPGKKRVRAADFLNGHKIAAGEAVCR